MCLTPLSEPVKKNSAPPDPLKFVRHACAHPKNRSCVQFSRSALSRHLRPCQQYCHRHQIPQQASHPHWRGLALPPRRCSAADLADTLPDRWPAATGRCCQVSQGPVTGQRRCLKHALKAIAASARSARAASSWMRQFWQLMGLVSREDMCGHAVDVRSVSNTFVLPSTGQSDPSPSPCLCRCPAAAPS